MIDLGKKLGVSELTKEQMKSIKGGEVPGNCTLTCYNPDDYENGSISVSASFCQNASDDQLFQLCDQATSGDTESAECDC